MDIINKIKLNRMNKLAFLYGIMMDTIRVLVVIITIAVTTIPKYQYTSSLFNDKINIFQKTNDNRRISC